MSVAAALAAILPVGYARVPEDTADVAQAVIRLALLLSEVFFAVCVALGLVVILSGDASTAPRSQLFNM
jgi:hypothetical protein